MDSTESAEKTIRKFGSIDASKLMDQGESILTGGGGGFVHTFQDFIVGASGDVLLKNYRIDMRTGEPYDIQRAPLLTRNRAEEFRRLMEMALDIGFFKLKLDLPRITLVRHTAVAHPDHGAHRVVWATEGPPTPPKELVKFDREIRRFLTESFKDEFGG